MIDTQRVEALLKSRYPNLESVGQGVFRGVDRFGARDYAVRYFDLNDRLATTADSLKSYQEQVLSPMYFSSEVATDLRWNHYLYFVTSDEEAQRGEFGRLKAKVEADREYARKQVVREGDVAGLFANAQASLRPPYQSTLRQHGRPPWGSTALPSYWIVTSQCPTPFDESLREPRMERRARFRRSRYLILKRPLQATSSSA
jgi:hypothetical protein